MECSKRILTHKVSSILASDCSFVEIPIGHIESRVAEDVMRKILSAEIHPTLVYEQSSRDVNSTVSIQTLLPPVEKRHRAGADADEPKVIHPSHQDLLLAR
jgi:hypothetical protein